MKGLAYPKTTWTYQERPVASAKLNTWDDRIEAALDLAFMLLSMAWGGANGVVPGVTANNLKVVPLGIPGLAVVVEPGCAFIARAPFRLVAAHQTPAVTPPTSQPRIDLVQARLATWDVGVKTGVEAAAPTAPSADADCLALARLYLRPGMQAIWAADDGINGYIVDVRSFL